MGIPSREPSGLNPSACGLAIAGPAKFPAVVPGRPFQSLSLNPIMPGIPTYGADGLRRRNHSLETLFLESRETVVLQRTRKGEVVCARFCGASYTPSRTRVNAGTRYSYLERIGGHRGWTHRRLPRIPVACAQELTNKEFAAELDYQRRLAFRAVQVSIREHQQSSIASEAMRSPQTKQGRA
jgi:hypothetical protein